jgi:membrane dipeptidase
MTPAPGAIPIFDGHNDTLLDIHLPHFGSGEARSFFTLSEFGHVDLPRARAGGLAGGFFAIFTPSNTGRPTPPPDTAAKPTPGAPHPAYTMPAPAVEQAVALKFTVDLAARLLRIEHDAKGEVKVVRTADELDRCLADGTLAMVFHIEGAEAIDADLNALHVLYAAGLRSLGIVWSRSNIFAHGVPFVFPSSPDTGPGLTDAGKALVAACNELGVLIDVSHLNEKGFWDVAKLSNAPLVATHSGAHALCASSRNLTDRQLDAIKASGGMVGVNFHVGFLRADGERDGATTSLTEIVRHVDYMVERMGIDHVGLGSDFDGAVMPNDLHDAAGLPKLIAALSGRYGENDLQKIAHANWQRVLRQTWCD